MEAMNKLLEETWGDLPAENDGEPPHIALNPKQAICIVVTWVFFFTSDVVSLYTRVCMCTVLNV